MKRILIIILALIVGLSVAGLPAGTFSGRWATDITIGPPRLPAPTGYALLGFGVNSVLTVNYEVAGWTFRSVSTLTHDWPTFPVDGWSRQDFHADGALGAFTLTNHLRFVPADATFIFLRSTAATTLAGVDFETRFLIVPDGSGLRLRVGGPVDGMTVRATTYFGSLLFDPVDPPLGPGPWALTNWIGLPVADRIAPTHALTFRGLDVDITVPFYSFVLTIDADFVSGLGFQDLTFSVPAFPLGVPGFTLGLEIKYTLAAKTVVLTPHFAVGEWVHFQPFITAVGLIDALRLDGLRMRWEVDERVTFTYEWDAAKGLPRIAGRCPREIDDYQQRIMIGAKIGLIDFNAAFAWIHPRRFPYGPYPYVMPMFPGDIALDLSAAIMPQLSLRVGVDLVDRAFYTLTFGFTVDW